MSIRQLHLESFGCVANATVDLEPLTVFVGPNDSGKSMLLRALVMLAEASRLPNGWRDVFPEPSSLLAQTFNGRGDAIRLGVSGQVGDAPFEYEVGVSAAPGYSVIQSERLRSGPLSIERVDKKLHLGGPPDARFEKDAPDGVRPLLHQAYLLGGHLRRPADSKEHIEAAVPLFHAVKAIQLYSLRPEALRAPTPPGTPLRLDGFGLSNAIAELMLHDRDSMERVEDALAGAMPHVRRVAVHQERSPGGLSYEIELITRSGARISSHMISDGVLLYLGYLYLVLGPNAASVLLIEEPETGIHFGLLRSVMKLFRDMTTGVYGPQAQILLTTHSPMLLNLVEPGEIRVVQRGEDDGATRVSRFSDIPKLDELLDYQGPGEIWVNQGEAYLTRGSAPS